MASIVDRTIVISADTQRGILDEKSLLCTENRHLLGRVDEIFGPVTSPRYTVRREASASFPSEVRPGAKIFFVEPEAKFVVPSSLHKKVGWPHRACCLELLLVKISSEWEESARVP